MSEKTTAAAPAKKNAEAPAVPAPAKKAESNGLSPQRLAILKLVLKDREGRMTRLAIGKALGIKSGFCSLLGHADPDKVEPKSLVGLGYLKAVQYEGEPVSYQLTAAGKKAAAK